jgi:hypothetical protein
MCTVTWLRESGGYHLLCNRDEVLARAEATPPQLVVQEGVRIVAPIDPEYGGTWVAVNEFGVSVALLNAGRAAAAAVTSRGLLTLHFAASESAADAFHRAAAVDWKAFAPCSVAILDPEGQAVMIEWDGTAPMLHPCADALLPLTSSSVAPEAARARRYQEFARRGPGVRGLLGFHTSHGGRPGALSACMHRGDAATVSFSWIQVTGERINFFYAPGAACQWRPGENMVLERAA